MKPILLHIPKTGGTSLLVSGFPGGHDTYYEKRKRDITILRNPLDRTLSQFNEQSNSNETIFSWWKKEYSNFQTNWLIKHLKVKNLEEVKERLKGFVLVTTENLTEQMNLLGYKIPHVNIKRKNYLPNEKEIEFIKSNNELDLELYNWVVCNHFIV